MEIQPEQSGGEERDSPVSEIAEGSNTIAFVNESQDERSTDEMMPPPSTPVVQVSVSTRSSRAKKREATTIVYRPGPASSKKRSVSGETASEKPVPEEPAPEEPVLKEPAMLGEKEPPTMEEVLEMHASHPFDKFGFDEEGEKEDAPLSRRAFSLERKRGRPITTGEYSKLAEAKRKVLDQREREVDFRLETTIRQNLASATKIFRGTEEGSLSEVSLAGLSEAMAENIMAVKKTATVSRGLKGTYKKALNDAAAYITAISDELSTRMHAQHIDRPDLAAIEELTNKLRAAEAKVAGLEAKMDNHQRELEEARKVPPPIVEQLLPKPQRPKRKASRSAAPSPSPSRMDLSDGETSALERDVVPSLPPRVEQEPLPEGRGPRAPLPFTPRDAELFAERVMRGGSVKFMAACFDAYKMRREGLALPAVESGNTAGPSTRAPSPPTPPPLPSKGKGKGKGKKKKGKQQPTQGGEQTTAKSAEQPTPKRAKPPIAQEQPETQKETWVTVVKKGGKKGSGAPKTGNNNSPPSSTTRGGKPPAQGAAKGGKGKAKQAPPPQPTPTKRRRPPRSAAITIGCPPGMREAVIREARDKIDLASFGIEGLRVKRTLTGALNYEVDGAERDAKADTLATTIRTLFAGRPEVRVTRPVKTAELRITGLDDAATVEEVINAVAKEGGCDHATITANAVRRIADGLGSTWVRCPLTAANKIAAAGRLKVGWVLARVTLLPERPLQCFRCLEGGHVASRCPSDTDRSDRCYRCGERGHMAKACKAAQPKCPVCTDRGRPAAHRVGGKACVAQNKGRRVKPLPQVERTDVGACLPQPGPSAPVPLIGGNALQAMETEREGVKRPRATGADSPDGSISPGGISSSKRKKTRGGDPTPEVGGGEDDGNSGSNGAPPA